MNVTSIRSHGIKRFQKDYLQQQLTSKSAVYFKLNVLQSKSNRTFEFIKVKNEIHQLIERKKLKSKKKVKDFVSTDGVLRCRCCRCCSCSISGSSCPHNLNLTSTTMARYHGDRITATSVLLILVLFIDIAW